ncbi:Phage integrase family protein [Nitrosomonas marina]|uniref:Phage integrase family protein n=1 Tax=Nitrosomonas marina TaxID=917 RepID=A0A1I0FS03_9PROT|nr:tyrosine-type recombinase/integrase [Nitrosomonas marina]SET60415.1 Phage integrase family protein [Nitrosomonas marina]
MTPRKKKNQAAVKSDELPELLRAISTYETIGDRQTQLALQLLALTFVRTNELIGAVWTEFDLDNAIWIVPAERMKMRNEHVVSLSSQAMKIIAELKTMAGNSRYLLCLGANKISRSVITRCFLPCIAWGIKVR